MISHSPSEAKVQLRTNRRYLLLSVVLVAYSALPVFAQQRIALDDALKPVPAVGSVASLPLNPGTRVSLHKALESHDYRVAERILLDAIRQNPNTPRLLSFLGGVYFLDGSYLECAVAMNKAEVLAPLPDADRFTLAMAYVVLKRSDWAQPELQRLAQADPHNPVYPYWLSRIAYHANHFEIGVAAAEKAIQLNSKFMRAYDNLGLCYEALGKYDLAIKSYLHGVALNRHEEPSSPWPPFDLGTLLVKLSKLHEAAPYLAEALRDDPRFPQAHFQMGLLLEKEGEPRQAILQLREAASLKPSYAVPHYVLGRIYGRMGKPQEARAEFARFKRLRRASQP